MLRDARRWRPAQSGSCSEYAPEGWDEADVDRFRRSLQMIAVPAASRAPYLSLETAFEDGRFTDVVEGLLIDYYDPLYQRSCVDGTRFVLELETSPDPFADARRFVRGMSRLIREVLS